MGLQVHAAVDVTHAMQMNGLQQVQSLNGLVWDPILRVGNCTTGCDILQLLTWLVHSIFELQHRHGHGV